MDSTFIIVWGMHRSGTSLIARSLEVFGANLGEELFEGNPGNPKGYFEDTGLMRFNMAMLKELGMPWDSLRPVREKDVRQLMNAGCMEYALDFLARVSRRGPVVALKDPRMTRLAPFWRRAFHKAGIKPINIVVFRQPEAVINSLAMRAKSTLRPGLTGDPLYAAYLWLGHTLASLLYTSGFPRALVQYEKFLKQPRQHLEKIGQICGLPIIEQAMELFCNSFVDKRLNHAPVESDHTESLPKRVADLAEHLSVLPDLSFPTSAQTGRMWPDSETEIDLCEFLDKSQESLRELWRKQMEAQM